MTPLFRALLSAVLATALSVSGCSSDKGPSSSQDSGAAGTGGSSSGTCTGGPETSASPDTHCTLPDGGAIVQPTGACQTGASGSGAAPDYGDTMKGTEGDDDDCKYHLSFTVPPICAAGGVTFTLTLTSMDGKPVTGANPSIEATTTDLVDIAQSSGASKEKAGSPGVYDIGPVVFGKPGKWLVRFHLFETCSDAPADSPHGHAAFFVDIP